MGSSRFVLGLNLGSWHELFAGGPLRITTQLPDWDHKRLHVFQQFRRLQLRRR